MIDSAALGRLSHRLRGVLDATEARPKGPAPQAIITLPKASTALRAALRDLPDSYETRDGFAHVAARARTRLVFLVPFIDAAGADALCRMLSESAARELKIVVRPDSRGERHYLRHAARLKAAGATLLEYWLERDSGDAPGLPAETFHAKVVLADQDVVYVGSSNLLASSLDGGLECGVLVEGESALPFRDIVDAVVSVARPV